MDIKGELCCSICHSLFSCPVTIPCGHSFCLECLQGYWSQQTSCICPLCRRPFPSTPPLDKNVTLSHICDTVREREEEGEATPQSADLCPVHGARLDFYCCTEGAVICGQCVQEHREHRTLPLEEAIQETQVRIQEQQSQVKSRLRREAVTAASLRDLEHGAGAEVCQALDELVMVTLRAQEQVGALLREEAVRLERSEARLRERLQEFGTLLTQEGHALLQGWQTLWTCPDGLLPPASQTDVLAALGTLQQAITELTEQLKTRLEDFTQSGTPRPETEPTEPTAQAGHQDGQTSGPDDQTSPQGLHTSNVTTASGTSQPESSIETAVDGGSPTTCGSGVPDSLTDDGIAPAVSEPSAWVDGEAVMHPVSSEDLLQCWTAVKFDTSTASAKLRISEGGLLASNSLPETQVYPKSRGRFTRVSQVLGWPGLELQHYWELEVSGGPVMVGLARPTLDRAGRGTSSLLGRNPWSWCLELSEHMAIPWHNNCSGDSLPVPSSRLGLHLDLRRQTLAFYSISRTVTLLHRFQGPFTPPLLPAFYIDKGASVRILPAS